MINYIVCFQDMAGVNSEKNWLDMLGQFFLLIIAFVVILVLAYYSTKMVAKVRLNGFKSNNIKIIESVSAGYQNMIQIVKVGSKFYLIGVTKEKITFLTEIEGDDLDITEKSNNEQVFPFEKYLKEYFNKNKK